MLPHGGGGGSAAPLGFHACAAALLRCAHAAHRLDGSVVVRRNASPAIAPPAASVKPTDDASATCATALPPAANAGPAAASKLAAAAAAAARGRTAVPEATVTGRREEARARRTRTGALRAMLPAIGTAIASSRRGAGVEEADFVCADRQTRRPSSAAAQVALRDALHAGTSGANRGCVHACAWCAPQTCIARPLAAASRARRTGLRRGARKLA